MAFIAYRLVASALLASILLFSNFFSDKSKPDISWQQPKLVITIQQGETSSADFGFITNRQLDDVSIWITPEIEKYVIVRPSSFTSIQAGSVVRIQTIFTVPEDLIPGIYDGTAHVRLGNRTIAKPLPVIINVQPKAPPPPLPEIIELFYDDGTAEAFDFDPVLGRAVFSAKFSSGGPTKILGVKIFLKIPSPSPSPIDVYIWDFNRNLLLPPVRVAPTEIAPTEGQFFTVDVSSQNLIVENEFYFGIAWPSSSAPPLLGVDLTIPQNKSFVVILPNTFIPVSNANLMIRAIIQKL